MSEDIKKKVLEAFSSMRTTDNVKLADYESLERIKKYYVDPFGYLTSIMSEEDNFIIWNYRGNSWDGILLR